QILRLLNPCLVSSAAEGSEQELLGRMCLHVGRQRSDYDRPGSRIEPFSNDFLERPLLFTSQSQFDSFATDINQMLGDGEVDFAYSTPSFTSPLLGKVTKFNNGGKDGSSVEVEYNSGAQLPANTPVTYLFSRPRTDYASTDITNLWYSWAQYYINQFASFNGE